MLAARDQENLVHGRQVAASSKPLNQGIINVPPKTPGAKPFKTPYKVPLNDENVLAGKTIIKGNNENLKTVGKAAGGFDKNAFVTPLGPRIRAPLGFKTTNAKAKPFQTPAVLPTVKNGPRSQFRERDARTTTARKPKPKISHAETAKVEFPGGEKSLEEEDEREIEYMPPKPKDLPDYPEDFPPDMEYSQFRGSNLTRGWFNTYCNPIGEDGLTRLERQLQESQKRADEESRELIKKVIDEMPLLGINVPEFPGDETIEGAQKRREAEKQQQQQQQKKAKALAPTSTTGRSKTAIAVKRAPPSTLTSKQAASLLSSQPSSTSKSTAIKPQPKPDLKLPTSTSLLSRSKPRTTTNPSHIHPTAAKVASTTTLGYNKGRRVSNDLNKARLSLQKQPPQPPRSGSSSSLASLSQIRGLGLDAKVQRKKADEEKEEKEEKEEEDETLADLKSMAAVGLAGPDALQELDAEEDFVLTLG